MSSAVPAPDFAPPLVAANAMTGFRRPWCVAGGWAIDLWLGRVTRSHSNVEIAVLRDHQLELRQHLADFTFKIAAPDGKLVTWKDPNQMFMLPVHRLFAAHKPTGRAWTVYLDESDGIDWTDRRHFEIHMNLAGWVWKTSAGVPVLNPLIVLLHKSRHVSPRDDLDLHVAVERLTESQKMWLRVALIRSDADHPWLDRL